MRSPTSSTTSAPAASTSGSTGLARAAGRGRRGPGRRPGTRPRREPRHRGHAGRGAAPRGEHGTALLVRQHRAAARRAAPARGRGAGRPSAGRAGARCRRSPRGRRAAGRGRRRRRAARSPRAGARPRGRACWRRGRRRRPTTAVRRGFEVIPASLVAHASTDHRRHEPVDDGPPAPPAAVDDAVGEARTRRTSGHGTAPVGGTTGAVGEPSSGGEKPVRRSLNPEGERVSPSCPMTDSARKPWVLTCRYRSQMAPVDDGFRRLVPAGLILDHLLARPIALPTGLQNAPHRPPHHDRPGRRRRLRPVQGAEASSCRGPRGRPGVLHAVVVLGRAHHDRSISGLPARGYPSGPR